MCLHSVHVERVSPLILFPTWGTLLLLNSWRIKYQVIFSFRISLIIWSNFGCNIPFKIYEENFHNCSYWTCISQDRKIFKYFLFIGFYTSCNKNEFKNQVAKKVSILRLEELPICFDRLNHYVWRISELFGKM